MREHAREFIRDVELADVVAVLSLIPFMAALLGLGMVFQ